jgi:hypothetical protein
VERDFEHNQKGKRIKHWPSGLVGLKLKKNGKKNESTRGREKMG